jgi:hypothetical protein
VKRVLLGSRVCLQGEGRGALLLDWYGKTAHSAVWVIECVNVDIFRQICDKVFNSN